MKSIFLFIGVICFISCTSGQSIEIKGNWIDKKNENSEISITEKEGNLILNGFNNKFELKKVNNYEYILKSVPKDYKVNLSKETGILNVNGIEYIPSSKALTKKIRGSWVNSSISKDTIYEFKEAHYSNTCYVWNDKETYAKYYPTKIDNGFEFTINGRWIRFIFDEKTEKLIDGNGNTYSKIASK